MHVLGTLAEEAGYVKSTLSFLQSRKFVKWFITDSFHGDSIFRAYHRT